MTPILTPLSIPDQPETEYRAEQVAFAEMQAEFQRAQRKARWQRALSALDLRPASAWLLYALTPKEGR